MGFRNPSPRRSRIRSLRNAGILLLVLIAAVVIKSATALKTHGAHIRHVTIDSRYVNGSIPLTLVIPRGGPVGRPLLVFLHDRGGDQNSELNDNLFRALDALGSRAPDIVFPNGSDHSYWHDRISGQWGTYVMREVIPTAIRLLGADGRRVAIGGIGMGGFGAYDLTRLNPGRFCAVGGHSAAVWTNAAAAAPGAFDNAADFARHDVNAAARARPSPFAHTALWLDGGSADPFHSADEALASALYVPMHVWPGAHDDAYWNAHWGDYLGFYAGALASCRRGR
jgi:poly(3-hydroxybutyrate) depolymerase